MTAGDVAARLGGKRVLGEIATDEHLHAAIQRGLPYGALRAVIRRVKGADGSVLLCLLLGVEAPMRRLPRSAAPLSVSQSELLAHVAQFLVRVEVVLGDQKKAARWLASRSRALDAVPMTLLQHPDGQDRVLAELDRINHGVVS